MSTAKKIIAVFLSMVLLAMPITVTAQAVQSKEQTEPETQALTSKPTEGIEAAGKIGEGLYTVSPLTRDAKLIIRISLTIAQVEGNKIRVNYATGAVATMAKIGGKDITIQRWDGSKWIDVAKADRIAENVSFHSGSFYSPTSLPTGYYYRATIKHYAKEQGWFFPASEEFYNETEFVLLA